MLAIGYIPLFTPNDADRFTEDPLKIYKLLDAHNAISNAIACLWTKDDNLVTPIFILNNGDAIYEHLLVWSEGEPEQWFNLVTETHGDDYTIAIVPRFDKIIDRLCIASLQYRGEFLNRESIKEVLTCPLHVTATASFWSKEFIAATGTTSRVGILDSAHLKDNIYDTDREKVRFVGPLPKVCNKPDDIYNIRPYN